MLASLLADWLTLLMSQVKMGNIYKYKSYISLSACMYIFLCMYALQHSKAAMMIVLSFLDSFFFFFDFPYFEVSYLWRKFMIAKNIYICMATIIST